MLPICYQKSSFVLCIYIITYGFPYMGAGNVMYCTAQVHSLNLLSMTHPHLKKKCLICAWTQQQKVAYQPRPAGGAVEKMGRCFSYYNGPVQLADTILQIMGLAVDMHKLRTRVQTCLIYETFVMKFIPGRVVHR